MDYSFVRHPQTAIFVGSDSSGYALASFGHPSDCLDFVATMVPAYQPDEIVFEVNHCRATGAAFLTRKHFIAWVRIAQGQPADEVIARYRAQEERRTLREEAR